jgi:c-di-AMP phosphodiesterase-like protein
MSGKKSKSSVRTQGKLQAYFVWPLVVCVILFGVNIAVCLISRQAGAVTTVFTVIYLIVLGLMWFYYKPMIMKEMVIFSEDYAHVQHQLMEELPIPYALLDDAGIVMWMNGCMEGIVGKSKGYGLKIHNVFSELTSDTFPKKDKTVECHIASGDRDYRVEMKWVALKSVEESGLIDAEDAHFISLQMFDETEMNRCKEQLRNDAFVAGLVYIDNYEEAFEGLEDARRSLFLGLVDKRVNKYFSPGASIVRKLEKDKYLVVFTHQFLEKLVADKFSILEDVKNINIGEEKNITISVGIGTDGEDYARNFDMARSAMDLALGRGGDQAVLKAGSKVTYFGGKSQMNEKNDRVKVRVKAQALRRVMENNDSFIIMGHRIADIDCIGSGIGIYTMARKMKKDVHIVLNEVTSTVEPFVKRFMKNEDYPDDMFYTSQEALDNVTPATVLIVVDVNKPEMTECPELLSICRTKIVFDHHRQTSEPITDTFMSYVDSSASSASEMVTEMLTYINEGSKLRGVEADALYAGIVIDTDGFNSKSGPRTFEVAAYLRRNGADVSRVRKLLRSDMREYQAIAAAVNRAEVYRDSFAITVFMGEGLKSPTIGGAKTANDLLDIRGIKASFVVTEYEGRIFASARSIDEVNVQLVMEKIGGGGHMTVAGAQLTNMTVNEAVNLIKTTLDEMLENEEI